jgi:predicted DsbA family dithiol-disulfide isomerase
MCSSLISQNLGESEDVKCSKCWEMKGHIDKLISELKSIRLIIKLLQEDIHLSSHGTKNQANLSNHVGHNTQVVLRSSNRESYT